MHFKPDLKKELSLDQPTYDSMKVMADMIERENNMVEKAYQTSLRDGQSYSGAIDAVSEVVGDDLSADLQDD
jgi:hypothetical protein